MRDVGVIDYLGLTTTVTKYIKYIQPKYDHIIVDEAQDFGTTELSIIRNLVNEKENDLFICGDIAQHVLPKHSILSQAGIVISKRSRRIRLNYRNSREILKAAYSVLIENLSEDLIDSSDLEILDPEFANRSSPQPCVLQAQNLAEEFGFARSLVSDHLEARPEDRCCIAFAGYSLREVQIFANKIGLPILDGAAAPNASPVVLSDLEQTKGYEFNIVVVINCGHGVLPPADTPEVEAFRYGCRLYVTMTRARDELYLSYHRDVSPWLQLAQDDLAFMNWSDVVTLNEGFLVGEPERLIEIEEGRAESILALDGRQFVYSPFAIGLSTDALLKIDELVDGRGLTREGRRVKWQTLESARQDLEKYPHAKQLFGPKVQAEIRDALTKI